LEKEGQRSTPSLLLNNYFKMFSNTNVYRVTKSLVKRATRRSQISGEAYVTLRDIRRHRVALLTRYIEATKAKELPKNEKFEKALIRLKQYHARVYFIPTNYRVYYSELEGAQAPALPNANWEYLKGLCTREGLDCINLTAAMARTGEALLAQGELL
jgi:hypothetical protein